MESKLQKRIIKDLKEKGIYALKVSLCNKPGHPDLSCFTTSTRTFFIEVKDEGEEAEPLQQQRHLELRRNGFTVYVIDQWEDYKNLKL